MRTEQLDIFGLWQPPPDYTFEKVEIDGAVVQGAPDETLALPRKGNLNPLAEIELHQHSDGRWMWSASFGLLNCSGHSYKVGPKWGRYAETRAGALRGAVDELTARLSDREACRSIPEIITWARGLI